VTACEKHHTMATIAKEVISFNKFDDKITLHEKHSYDLKVGEDMPDKADVLVCEIMDSFLLGEWMLPSIDHARKALLKPNAAGNYRIIPSGAKITAMPIESDYGFGLDARVEGFDLSAFRLQRQVGPLGIELLEHTMVRLTDPVDIFQWDLTRDEFVPQDKDFYLDVKNPGMLNAVAIWFTCFVDDEISFTTGPEKQTHWSQGMVLFPNDVAFHVGDRMKLTASHNTTSLWFTIARL